MTGEKIGTTFWTELVDHPLLAELVRLQQVLSNSELDIFTPSHDLQSRYE